MEVDVDSIRPSPYQPRLIFDQEDLKQEIKKDGLLSDLVVRNRGEFYEIIDGERRWRALEATRKLNITTCLPTLKIDDNIERGLIEPS